MEKERTLKQLYTVLHKTCDKAQLKHYGICWTIERAWDNLHITREECDRLNKHFDKQRPTKTLHKGFYYKNGPNDVYWWPCYYQRANDDNEPVSAVIRSKFLKHLIKIL